MKNKQQIRLKSKAVSLKRLKKINPLYKIIWKKQGESTIINIRNERRNIRANLTAIRKDDKTTVLCEKKISKCKKEATGCLQVSKKGEKKNLQKSHLHKKKHRNDKLEMEEMITCGAGTGLEE